MASRKLARILTAAAVAAFGALAAPLFGQTEGKPMEPGKEAGKEIVTASGLKYVDEKVGEGDEAKAGKVVEVHYTGWLENGTKFDSSRDRGTPLKFKLGVGTVIKGWDEGLTGMRVGGKRKLLIPSALGYGKQGAGGLIPPNANLVFEVELLGVS
jgi:FKBP-type peptidyl-prolyl cis-trans isomerase